jgi:hypothetical protein
MRNGGIALLVLVALTAAFWLGRASLARQQTSGATKVATAPMADRIETVSAPLAGSAPRTRSSQGDRSPAAQSASDDEPEAHQQQARAAISHAFSNQAIDKQWSHRTTALLESALINTAAEQEDMPAPDALDMQCRTSMCRIEARYPDEDSAIYGVQLLQSAFASELPRAYQYLVNNPDGTVSVVMYASKAPS